MTEQTTPDGPDEYQRAVHSALYEASVDGQLVFIDQAEEALWAVRDQQMDRMKVLVAASESPGHAVRLAAQYADRAIENGERANRLEERLRLLTDEKVAYVTGPTTDLLCEEINRLKAEVDAARAYAEEMRGFCSPHGVATDYADQLVQAMDRTKEGRA